MPEKEVKPKEEEKDVKKDPKATASDLPKEPKKEAPKEVKASPKAPKPVTETKTITHDANEKVFTIALRKAFRKSQKKRADYATSLVKEFLKRHLKSDDVKLGEQLNRKIWEGGNSIPRKVRVKTVVAEGIVKAELMGFEYKDFKAMPKKEKQGMKDKLMGRLGPKALQKQKEEAAVKGEKAKAPERPQKIDRHVVEEE